MSDEPQTPPIPEEDIPCGDHSPFSEPEIDEDIDNDAEDEPAEEG